MKLEELCKDIALSSYFKLLLEQDVFVLTEDVIKEMHRLLYRDIAPAEAGKYREESEELLHYLGHYLGQLEVSGRFCQPVEFAAIAHKRFMDVRPFAQGNETIAELLLHLWLMRAGYETVSLNQAGRAAYEAALQKARNPECPDPEALIHFIAQHVIKK